MENKLVNQRRAPSRQWTALNRCNGWIAVTLLTLAAFAPASARAAVCDDAAVSLQPVYDGFNQPFFFPWQGESEEADVCFPSRDSGAQLKAYLIAPKNIVTIPDGSLPVVVIGPGSVNGIALYYKWAARDLAGHGYIAVVTDPQGAGRSQIVGDCGADGCFGVPFQSASNYVSNLRSAIDYVVTREHAWLKKADLTRIGVAGHSLSARSAAYVGSVDERVGAVVAWDNMAGDLDGDEGTPSGEGACAALIGGELPGSSTPIVPRVPTLGQASDANGTCNYEKNLAYTSASGIGNDPELKKTGYRKWKQAGIASMLLAFTGAAHGDWAQQRGNNAAAAARIERQLEVFEHYTRAWFDLYLYGDEPARQRLLARTLPLTTADAPGLSIEDTTPQMGGLSRKFRSAAFMPEVGLGGCEALIPTTTTEATLDACNLALLPPVLGVLSNQSLLEDATSSLDLSVRDATTPADQLTVTAQSDNPALLPAAGLTLGGSGNARRLHLRPAADQSGTAAVTVTLADASQRTASRSFTLTVTPVNDAPRIISAPLTSAVAGGLYRYAVQATDVDDAPAGLTYRLLDPPAGMTISSSGVIEWTPGFGPAREVPVKVQVADGGEDGAAPAEQDYTLAVTAASAPLAATLSAVFSRAPAADGRYAVSTSSPLRVTYTVSSTGGDDSARTYALIFGDGDSRTLTTVQASAVFSHDYVAAGDHVAQATVSQNGSSTPLLTRSFTTVSSVVVDPPPVTQPLTALLTVTPTTVVAGDVATPVVLDASRTVPESGRSLADYRFAFDFGDGFVVPAGEARSASHVYSRAGTFEPKLTVTEIVTDATRAPKQSVARARMQSKPSQESVATTPTEQTPAVPAATTVVTDSRAGAIPLNLLLPLLLVLFGRTRSRLRKP